MPLVGQIYVAGRTTAETAALIAAALANGFVRNPDVAVRDRAYRPFFIQGAVRNRRPDPLRLGHDHPPAVSTAEATSTRRTGSARRSPTAKSASRCTRASSTWTSPIFPGDTIVIAERWLSGGRGRRAAPHPSTKSFARR